MIKTSKTVYDKPESSDGTRILVTRYWPRGISKEKIDEWHKDLGTEKDLIKKWKSGKISWEVFAKEYKASLRDKTDLLKSIAERSKSEDISLLCQCKDETRCHRMILAKEILKIASKD